MAMALSSGGHNSSTDSNSFFDDIEPRPPPRFPFMPRPFNSEKQRPEVPGVSPLLDSPAMLHIQDDVKALLGQSTLHGDRILNIEEKLGKILEFQETFLSQLFRKGSAATKETQTVQEKDCTVQKPSSGSDKVVPSRRTSPPKPTNHGRMPEYMKENTTPRSTLKKLSTPVDKLRQKLNARTKQDEDISAILKDIQLPNMDEPSVFSDVSGIGLKSVELRDFDEESFRSDSSTDSPIPYASASGFGSNNSSDGEGAKAKKPSETFYNNVLGNNNRLLEGNTGRNKPPRDYAAVGFGSSNRVPQKPLSSSSTNSSSNGSSNSNRNVRREENIETRSNSSRKSPVHFNTLNKPNTELSNAQQGGESEGDTVVEATKKYLEKLGVQFGSPSPVEKQIKQGNYNNRNYMIQQNVYNSIYIPTLNCAPIVPEVIDSSSHSGNLQMLAQKYVSSSELQQYEALNQTRNNQEGANETTLYGMSPNNLSFATKEYLQRYGLVNQSDASKTLQPQPPQIQQGRSHSPLNHDKFFDSRNDRILDITAIRSQPKLL